MMDDLQKRLIKRFEDIFEGQLFKGQKGQKVPVKVYEQHLPIPKSNENIDDDFAAEDNSLSFYPAIIVQLDKNDQASWNADEVTNVIITIGVYDDDESRNGYKDVNRILRKSLIDFKTNRRIDGRYELEKPPLWQMHDEDLHPFYFGFVALQIKDNRNLVDEEVNKYL